MPTATPPCRQQSQGADLHPPALSPLEPLHRRQAQPSLPRLASTPAQCATSPPTIPHDVPPFSLEGGGCGCAFSPDSKELAFTENLDPEPAISTNADIFTLDLTNPAAKPVKVSTSLGGNFNPAYSPDGKYLAWRSQARAGYESDKFRLLLYDRAAKTIKDLLPKFDNWVDEFAWESRFTGRSTFVSGDKGEAPIYLRAILRSEALGIQPHGAEFSRSASD